MTGTYLELQNRTQTRIIDLPSAVQAEIPQLVNEAMHELQSRHTFKVMETELYVYTQINNRLLQTGATYTGAQGWTMVAPWPQNASISNISTPLNVKEWRDRPVYVRFQDGSMRFITMAGSRQDIYGYFTDGDIGYPSIIFDSVPTSIANAKNLQVWPLPDGLSDWPDGEYRILMPYYGYLPNLVSSADSNWLTTNTHGERFIVNWATAEGFSLDWDVQNEQKWKAKAELELKFCVMEDKKYRLGPVNEFATHARGQYAGRTRS